MCSCVFRNLSFDSMEEDLEDLMEEYGVVKYARIVMDQNTGHSKGNLNSYIRYRGDRATSLVDGMWPRFLYSVKPIWLTTSL